MRHGADAGVLPQISKVTFDTYAVRAWVSKVAVETFDVAIVSKETFDTNSASGQVSKDHF